MNKEIILIGGGVRSGKSAFALQLAEKMGDARTFFATAEASDSEMSERIKRHQQEREGRFATIEEPLALPERLASDLAVDVVVVDCITLWISNLMRQERTDNDIDRAVTGLVAAMDKAPFHTLLVTNEVGMGVVPASEMGRRFRDSVGRAHQRLAAAADRVYLAALGCILQVKPTLGLAQPIAQPEYKDE